MATIEAGELFVVTRGYELGRMSLAFATMLPFGEPEQSGKPQTDRSHEGLVYRAIEVCGPMVSAECVFSVKCWRKGEDVGEVVSLNTSEIEVWPVTEKYLKSLKAKGPQ